MPKIFMVEGYRFSFFSDEGTESAHVHVEKAGARAKFWLDPISLSRQSGFNPNQMRRLRNILKEKREEFKDEWNKYFGP